MRTAYLLLSVVLLLLGRPSRAIAQTAADPADSRAAENLPTQSKSLTEVNKELSNPISSIWAIAFQENTYWAEQARPKQRQSSVSTRASGVFDGKLELDHQAGVAVDEFRSLSESERKPASSDRIRRHGSGLDALTNRPPGRKLAHRGGPDLHLSHRDEYPARTEQMATRPRGRPGLSGREIHRRRIPARVGWSVGGAGSNTISQFNCQYFASYFLRDG